MIPYSIQYVCPSANPLDNINIKCDYIENNKLDETIIYFIVEFMYDFCKGENVQEITSYKDFCEIYWKTHGLTDWYYIFKVEYFEHTWRDWNIEDYQDQIYRSYAKKYKK